MKEQILFHAIVFQEIDTFGLLPEPKLRKGVAKISTRCD